MFADGATPGKVDRWCYSAADEDFTSGALAGFRFWMRLMSPCTDATALDTWVLDRVEELFVNASADRALADRMRQPGSVFFLHLLGLDTTGHAYRPNGIEYYNNLVVVDDLVARVEARFDEFFERDGRTAFVFTADHGMSNIGNHGDGHPDNTRTPLVVWGAGVRPATQGIGDHDIYSREWGMDATMRQDVEQADVAALMVRTLCDLALRSVNFVHTVGSGWTPIPGQLGRSATE
jgi:phosphatidylinositol glycan class N